LPIVGWGGALHALQYPGSRLLETVISIWFSSTLVLDTGIAIGLLYVFSTFSSEYAYSTINFHSLAFRAGSQIFALQRSG
jgi:hypothetical protein